MSSQVPSLIRSPAVVVRADASIAEAVGRMKEAEVGAVLVLADDGSEEIAGIFTERDLLRKVDVVRAGNHWDKPVRTVMTRPVRTVDLDEIGSAPEIMLEMNVRHLPVVRPAEDGTRTLLGVVSMRELFRAEVRRRQDREAQGILDVAAGADLSGEIRVVEAQPRLASVLAKAFVQFPGVAISPERPEAIAGAAPDVARFAKLAALLIDVDAFESQAWKTLLKALNHANDMPRVFLAYDSDRHPAVDQEVLFKLSRSRQFTSFVKPVNVSALLLRLTPLLMR